MVNKIGIDVGGVIIDRLNDNTDTSFFTDRYLETTAVSNAFEAIKLLNKRFNGESYLVSKCGIKTMEKTKHWLLYHDFYHITRISPDHANFCLTRAEKAPICERLELTHFIDDRLEVLGYIKDIVPNLYLFNPSQKEMKKYSQFLKLVTVVYNWEGVLDKITI
jgi:hypothetical protein